jgi:hypothetical protein
MADIVRIKQNIQKMVDQGAPEADIDEYLSVEGVSLEQLRGESKTTLPISQVASEAISNIPGSALEYGKAVVSPITHPIRTAKGTGQIGFENLPPVTLARFIQKAIGQKESALAPAQTAMLSNYAERYGGAENIKETIAKDPVGVLGDLATLFTGAGAAAKAGGFSKTANVISKTGAAIEPLSILGAPVKAAVKGVAKIPGFTPEKLYTSAVKPSFTKRKGLEQVTKEMKTGLEAGILPTAKGAQKLQGLIDEIDNVVMQAAEEGSKEGIKISSKQALEPVLEVIDRAKNLEYSPYPKESLDIISDATVKFISEYGDDIDVLTAHKAKKAFYKQNRPKYGKQAGVVPDETVITEKAIARGLKDAVYEALANKHPELKALGEKEGALIGLKGAIEQGAQRIAKRDIMGIGLPIKAGAGTVAGKLTGVPGLGTTVGVIAGILDTPTIKARLAIALNKAKKTKLFNEKAVTMRQAARFFGETGRFIEEAPEEEYKNRLGNSLKSVRSVRP